ncbi:hypothetical protein TNIN_452641 [Trichonephila inaurata madagascariensis]|uniref:BTB domain-containing protein n=1 Tax=Trichonephila inaurata madagascariensis TaxID=2747483 RepID=A0A8X6XF89_9ARAC|nr:hypothetical protein TNIN_452641 [Trichonephila inaurata madagascariensis]
MKSQLCHLMDKKQVKLIISNAIASLESESGPASKRQRIDHSNYEGVELFKQLKNFPKTAERFYPGRKVPETDLNFNEGCSTDWRDKMEDLRRRNLYILRNSILSDVMFYVGPEKTVIRAHRLLLAVGSPVFQAMFYGSLPENGSAITIPDVMPDGFQVLLKYLYGDIFTAENESQVFHTWIAADKYCIPKLKEECVSCLMTCRLIPSVIWPLLENSMLCELKEVVDRCKKFLKKDTDICLQEESFLNASVAALSLFLQLDSMNIGEATLIKYLIFWGHFQVSNLKAANLSEAMRPIIKYIRFGALKPDQFCQILSDAKGLMHDSDALAIVMHLVNPLNQSLPKWCCIVSWDRNLMQPAVRDQDEQPKRKRIPDSFFHERDENE